MPFLTEPTEAECFEAEQELLFDVHFRQLDREIRKMSEQDKTKKQRSNIMTDKEIRVRCNHCMSVVCEEYLIKDNGTDSGERCPVCNKSDALMDVSEKGRKTETD